MTTLTAWWRQLATLKLVYILTKHNRHVPVKRVLHGIRDWNALLKEENVVGVLTSAQSIDAFERLPKNATQTSILTNWKRYFRNKWKQDNVWIYSL